MAFFLLRWYCKWVLINKWIPFSAKLSIPFYVFIPKTTHGDVSRKFWLLLANHIITSKSTQPPTRLSIHMLIFQICSFRCTFLFIFSSYSFKLFHFWCVCLNFSNCPNIIFYSVEIHKLIINNKVILSLASNDHTGQMFVSAIDHLFKQSWNFFLPSLSPKQYAPLPFLLNGQKVENN